MTTTGLLFTPENYAKTERGEKTQTRRIMKPQPPDWVREFGYSCFTPKGSISGRGTYKGKGPAEKFFKCPYGTVGDRLYVKEGLEKDGQYIRYRRGLPRTLARARAADARSEPGRRPAHPEVRSGAIASARAHR